MRHMLEELTLSQQFCILLLKKEKKKNCNWTSFPSYSLTLNHLKKPLARTRWVINGSLKKPVKSLILSAFKISLTGSLLGVTATYSVKNEAIHYGYSYILNLYETV